VKDGAAKSAVILSEVEGPLRAGLLTGIAETDRETVASQRSFDFAQDDGTFSATI
jgi:hypothetical protein